MRKSGPTFEVFRMHLKLFCLAAGLLATALVQAAQWFRVDRPGGEAGAGPLVEVDLETVRVRGPRGEGVIRVSHDLQQPHPAGFGYRSFVATAQFDCQRLTVNLSSAAYYAEPAAEGARLGADSAGRENGMPPGLLDSVPLAVRRSLLRATCATTQTY
jgi:hypothetical protein